jgi:hypothetical protein
VSRKAWRQPGFWTNVCVVVAVATFVAWATGKPVLGLVVAVIGLALVFEA